MCGYLLCLYKLLKLLPCLVFQPPEMLKRMVPFNSSFKSNTKRQVIHTYHHLSELITRVLFLPVFTLPSCPSDYLVVGWSLSDWWFSFYFFNMCFLSLLASALPIGPVVKLMHDCTFIDLELTIVLWTYGVGPHVRELWSQSSAWLVWCSLETDVFTPGTVVAAACRVKLCSETKSAWVSLIWFTVSILPAEAH